MRLVPFEPGHLARVDAGPFERLAAADVPAVLHLPGPAFSLIADDGAVLGCGGLAPQWRGVARGWIYASDRLRAHPVALHRAVRRALDGAQEALALHRIEISVHEDFTASRRWVERLGFRCEGEMPAYGPNKDTYIRYARIRP